MPHHCHSSVDAVGLYSQVLKMNAYILSLIFMGQFRPFCPPPPPSGKDIASHFVAAFTFPVSCWWPIDPVHWPSGEEDPRPLQDAPSSTTYCNHLILNSLLETLRCTFACIALGIFSADFSRAVLCPSVPSLCRVASLNVEL